jgi:hypothetical protein
MKQRGVTKRSETVRDVSKRNKTETSHFETGKIRGICSRPVLGARPCPLNQRLSHGIDPVQNYRSLEKDERTKAHRLTPKGMGVAKYLQS